MLVASFLMSCDIAGVADDVNIAVVPADRPEATIRAFVGDVSYYLRYSMGIRPGARDDPVAGRAVGGKVSIESRSVPCRLEVWKLGGGVIRIDVWGGKVLVV